MSWEDARGAITAPMRRVRPPTIYRRPSSARPAIRPIVGSLFSLSIMGMFRGVARVVITASTRGVKTAVTSNRPPNAWTATRRTRGISATRRSGGVARLVISETDRENIAARVGPDRARIATITGIGTESAMRRARETRGRSCRISKGDPQPRSARLLRKEFVI